jgi:hypothetical protein
MMLCIASLLHRKTTSTIIIQPEWDSMALFKCVSMMEVNLTDYQIKNMPK